MRDAIFYSVFLAAGLTLAVFVQFGWRPPFAFVWDGPSQVAFQIGCMLAVILSGFGLGKLIPPMGLPKLAHSIVQTMPWAVPSMIFSGISTIPRNGGWPEIVDLVLRAGGVGILCGVGFGFLSLMDNDKTPIDIHPRLNIGLGVIALAVFGFLAIPRPADKMRFDPAATFEHQNAKLELGVASTALGDMGMLRLISGGKVNTLVLDRNEWRDLSSLIWKAAAAQSPEWRVAGVMEDHSPGDSSTLVVSSGSGLRFHISSQVGDTVEIDLPSSDIGALKAAATSVQAGIKP